MFDAKYLETICKEYDLPVSQNPRDNFLMIVQAAEPTKEEKWFALEIYEQWLLKFYDVEV